MHFEVVSSRPAESVAQRSVVGSGQEHKPWLVGLRLAVNGCQRQALSPVVTPGKLLYICAATCTKQSAGGGKRSRVVHSTTYGGDATPHNLTSSTSHKSTDCLTWFTRALLGATKTAMPSSLPVMAAQMQ